MPPTVYAGTYSNVPVYETKVKDVNVMRRREDDYVNATHLLKIADFDKPHRTRILEKEIQIHTHQKVQGGYGKYQGTWVPLERAVTIAKQYKVYDLISTLLEYVPGDVEPPPAPKHNTSQSSKPKAPPKAAPPKKVLTVKAVPIPRQYQEESYDNISVQLHDDDSPDNSTVMSESVMDEEDSVYGGNFTGSRKRKRGHEPVSHQDRAHTLWADALLDYFMLREGEDPDDNTRPPTPPHPFQVDRPVDNEGHTAIHWAAATGDISLVQDLMQRGANIRSRNIRGETPLIRAALFANCYEKRTWPDIVHLLQETIDIPDNWGGSILHHVGYTAHTGSRTQRARHYFDVLLGTYSEIVEPARFAAFLNLRDRQGDTAFHVATRNSRRCMKAFQAYDVASDIPNHSGETVNMYIKERAETRRKNGHGFSSSPVQTPRPNGNEMDIDSSAQTVSFSSNSFHAQSSVSFSESFGSTIVPQVQNFLQAGEDEYTDKVAHLSDAESLHHKAKMDLQIVRQQMHDLESVMEDTDSSILQAELEVERKIAEGLEEQKQHRALHQLVRDQEDEAATPSHSNGAANEQDLTRKIEPAKDLHDEQNKRRLLTEEVVQSQADEGMTANGEKCKTLVADVLNVPLQEVLSLVPEVLEQLEFSKEGTVAVQ